MSDFAIELITRSMEKKGKNLVIHSIKSLNLIDHHFEKGFSCFFVENMKKRMS